MTSCSVLSRLARPSVPILTVTLLLTLVGCQDDAPSPTAPESTPALATGAAAGPLSFRQISAGIHHTCGVTTGDRAYCWGGGTVTASLAMARPSSVSRRSPLRAGSTSAT